MSKEGNEKIYSMVTDRILEMLNQGNIPWHKPWKTGYPKNMISKKEYQGINHFLLSCAPYSSPLWLTYNQAKEKGGNIRKGEKGFPVIFWKQIPVEKDGVKKTIPFLRYSTVFNLEQTEGIEIPENEKVNNDFSPIEKAENIVSEMPLKPLMKNEGNRAFYSPATDSITVPVKETFDSPEFYYSVLFHEMAHATGHSSRLCREGVTNTNFFGSHEYSKEELVAEFTASFLCGVAHIEKETMSNSAAYIDGWAKKIKSDHKLVIEAASKAQKAANFILNIKSIQNDE